MKNKLVPRRNRSMQRGSSGSEHPFDTLFREVNELFDTYWDRRTSSRRMASAGWELSETDDEVRIQTDLPGMDEKDIQVSIEEDVLTIRGERKEEKETRRRNYHVSEMSYGGYRRTIPLPAEVDATKAKAQFKRGVLTLNLPKTERGKAARKHIPIIVE